MDEEKDKQMDHNKSSEEEEEEEATQKNSIQSSEEEGNDKKGFEETDERCPLSHPGDPHTLSRRDGNLYPLAYCYACGNKENFPVTDFYYHCTPCDASFHEFCTYIPSKRLHPYHPQHPLTFVYQRSTMGPELGLIFDHYTDANISGIIVGSQPLVIFDKCSWCTSPLTQFGFYLCLICNFCLDDMCASKSPPLTIANPKSHHHSLVLLSRPLGVPCDACGLIQRLEPIYACFQCNYMVHQSCTDLPRVIKITRHSHRISHTPQHPPITTTCRVCYKAVDIKYGQYSCSEGDCSYAVHSRCATHEVIWDGKELEWELEQTYEDYASFKKVGLNLIEHFAHEHHLRLEKYDCFRDAEKQCQACTRPIDSRDFYNCLQCEFFFHEVCAGVPRKLEHALHRHTLVLDTCPKDHYHQLNCSSCSRASSGFKYKCADACTTIIFQLNLCCILVPEYFTHKGHQHPLFISTRSVTDDKIFCKVCKERCWLCHLQCTQCEFAMCYQYVTIPTELYSKLYDQHPLSLCYGETIDEIYWCEVCEKRMDTTTWFYTCDKCDTTIHHQCLFDSSAYMKCGYTFSCQEQQGKVVRNSSNSRSICSLCDQLCPGYIYVKFPKSTFCSMSCLKHASKFSRVVNGYSK